jgi:hypothetical protein
LDSSEPEMTVEKTGKQEVNAPSVPGATTEELGKSRKGDRIAAIHYASEAASGGTPVFDGCAGLSVLSGRSGGGYGKKDVKRNTTEASMYMKTNKSRTKSLEKSRTFMYKIRTFASNRHEFCTKNRLCDAILPVPFGYSRVFSCIILPNFGAGQSWGQLALQAGGEGPNGATPAGSERLVVAIRGRRAQNPCPCPRLLNFHPFGVQRGMRNAG